MNDTIVLKGPFVPSKAEFEAKLKSVAKILGFNVVDRDKTDGWARQAGYLQKGDLKLFVAACEWPRSDKGKLEFSACAPRYWSPDGQGALVSFYDKKFPRAKMAFSKTPEQMAKDVSKRVLAEYEALMVEARARILKDKETKLGKTAGLKYVADQVPGAKYQITKYNNEESVRVDIGDDFSMGTTLKAYYEGGLVEFELKTTPDQAARILKMLISEYNDGPGLDKVAEALKDD